MNMVFTAYGVVRFLFDVYAWAADDTPVLSGVAKAQATPAVSSEQFRGARP